MRKHSVHIIKQWGKVLVLALLLMTSHLLSAQISSADERLLEAYLREDMSVWQNHIDSFAIYRLPVTPNLLLYEYGYCGYLVDKDKEAAKPYVKRFKQHIEEVRQNLPVGHYEMWMSAVYVYELRLKESIHPVKAMSMAKEATKLAPADPFVLSYYGTCLFYAPKPFGSKAEALEWFEKAEQSFRAPEYRFCWLREATDMYIRQCHEKLKK